jgi:outer membrane receptor for ferric coprogen and ferric-rhodotorulic acid
MTPDQRRAVRSQVEAAFRSDHARKLATLAIRGIAKDNGAMRGRAIAAQEEAKRYYEHAQSLAIRGLWE